MFELAEGSPIGFSLRRQQGAVLAIGPGTLQIDHQDTGDIHRDFSPCILLDQRKRENQSRSSLRRRTYPAVAHEDCVRLDCTREVTGREAQCARVHSSA